MVTNDERREVARKLRELPIDMPSEIGKWEEGGLFIEPSIYDEADYSQIHNVLFDCFPAEHMHPCDYDELHMRLADLIEPEQVGTCAECAEFDRASKITPCRAFHGHTEADVTACDDFKPMKCDRDALLKLADEIQMDGADSLDDDDWCKGLLYEYAARIREALGVKS